MLFSLLYDYHFIVILKYWDELKVLQYFDNMKHNLATLDAFVEDMR